MSASLVKQRRPRRVGAVLVTLLVAAVLVVRLAPSSEATSDDTPYEVPQVVDVNPDPDIVETTIIADELTIDDIGDDREALGAMAFNGSIPGPEFRLTVGQHVRVHFENHLADEDTGIHWHGIELANAVDGSQLVQQQVEPGGSFIYDFVVPRAGVYWYHPHHHYSTNQVVRGLYGSIIVEDPNEAALRTAGVLPSLAETHTLMIGDMTICKAPGQNDTVTYPNTLPHVSGGPLPAQGAPHPDDLCDSPVDREGVEQPGSPLPAGTIANVQPSNGSVVNEGQTVVTNGVVAGHRDGTPAAPGALAANAHVLDITPGKGLRLQVINPSQVRYLRLRLTLADGTFVPLLRVGGEGGLLNEAVLDGGNVGGFDFKYAAGEALMGPSERVDVVAAIPAGASGVATLWTQDFQRLGNGFANTPTVPVAHYNVTGTAPATPFTIAAGTDLRSATGDTVPVLTPTDVDGAVLDPAAFSPAKPGNATAAISLGLFNVNGVPGEHHFEGDYTEHPKATSTRWAKLGDTIELTVFNNSGLHHPFHLHGFSFQPLTLTRTGASFTFPPEYVDAVDVPPQTTLTYRVHLEDRPQMDGTTPGGGAGRWVFHCHIFFHAVAGMMSELIVVGPDGNEKPYVDLLPTLVEANEGDVATVTGDVMDPDGDTVAMSANIGSVVDNGDGTWTWTHDTSGAPGTETVFITGTDPDGLTGQIAFDLDVEPAAVEPGPPIYRLNTGGATVAALVPPGGPPFSGITAAGTSIPGLTLSGNVTGPTTNTNTFAPLTDGAPNALYQSTMHTPTGGAAGTGQLNFDFTVPAPGDYEVKLFFAENAAAITAPGQRLFDVALEGTTVLNDHDIFATVGALNIPDIQTLQTTVTDGVLDFDLIAQVNIAGIRGIQISPLFELPNVAPTITASPNPAFAATGRTTVVDLTANDPEGDPITTQITAGPSFASLVGGDLQLTPTLADLAGSPYTVTVEASDGDLTDTVDVTVNVTDVLYRLNTGGATVAALVPPGGPPFSGITAAGTSIPGLTLSGNVTGPTTNTNTFAPLTDGAPNALYQSTMHTPTGGAAGTGQLNFDFTVPAPGDYEVKLFFAENAAAITAPGQRLFDVALEGTTVLNDHDIFATVGALNIPDIQTLQTTVTDGVLDFDLIAQVNIAGIRGIQIRPVPAVNQAPTITAVPDEITVTVGDTETVDLTTNDPDGDTVTTSITSGQGFASIVGGELELSPTAGDVAGSPHTVTVQVTDGDLTDTVDVTVTVEAANQAPTITAVPDEITVTVGDTETVDLTTNDPDGDLVTTSITSGQGFASIVGGELELSPTAGDVAGSPHTVTVQVTDGDLTDTVDVTVTVEAAPVQGSTAGDFDGDGDSDVGVFRPSSAQWFVQPSGGFSGIATTWGAAGDIPVSGDFNGDGTGDVAVFRPSTQSWFVQPNSGFPAGLATAWGVAGDIPVPADFNGDGITDIAVFRPSDQTWYAQPNSGLPAGLATQWGVTGDVPVPADFDGDGVDEVAVYRPSDQTWYSQTSGLATQWGVTGDIPVPVDFDGDGSDEVAVYRPSDRTWYSQSSGLATQWGAAGDVAVAADYDGDGTADVAVYRPSDATWYVQGGVATQWGTTGDLPVHIPHAIRQLYP